MCLKIIPLKKIIKNKVALQCQEPYVSRKVNTFLCTVFLEGNLFLKNSPRADLHKTNVIGLKLIVRDYLVKAFIISVFVSKCLMQTKKGRPHGT